MCSFHTILDASLYGFLKKFRCASGHALLRCANPIPGIHVVHNGTAWTCGALAENEIAQFCHGNGVRRLQTESRGSGGGFCEAILALKSVPITILRRRRRTPPGHSAGPILLDVLGGFLEAFWKLLGSLGRLLNLSGEGPGSPLGRCGGLLGAPRGLPGGT